MTQWMIQKEKKTHILHYVHYNEHRDPKNYYKEQSLFFVPFFNNENNLRQNYFTWHKT
jgi:hypothetical protein